MGILWLHYDRQLLRNIGIWDSLCGFYRMVAQFAHNFLLLFEVFLFSLQFLLKFSFFNVVNLLLQLTLIRVFGGFLSLELLLSDVSELVAGTHV